MTLANDNGTDGQTDRRTDRERRNMRPPPTEEGRIISVRLDAKLLLIQFSSSCRRVNNAVFFETRCIIRIKAVSKSSPH